MRTVFFLLLCSFTQLNSQNKAIKKFTTYDLLGAYVEDLKAIKLKDGNFIVCINTYADSIGSKKIKTFGQTDAWLTKIDSNGNKLWEKSFGGSGNDAIGDIIQTMDLGFLMVGSSESPPSGNKSSSLIKRADIWIVKLDSNGNKLWDKSYGDTNSNYGNKILELSNGDIVIGSGDGYAYIPGYGYIEDSANYDIMKCQPNGDLIWKKRYGGSKDDWINDLILLPGDTILIAGESFSGVSRDKTTPIFDTNFVYSSLRGDVWLVKIDKNGNKIWDKGYGGCLSDGGATLKKYNDSILVLFTTLSLNCGAFSEVGTGAHDMLLMCIDQTGKKLWDKMYGGVGWDAAYAIELDEKTKDIYIGGYSTSPIGPKKSEDIRGGEDIWLIKIDSTRKKIWDKTIGGNSNETVHSLFRIGKDDLLIFCTAGSKIIEGIDIKSLPYGRVPWIATIGQPTNSVKGKIFADLNNDCNYSNPNEYSISNKLIYNKSEGNYTLSNDSGYFFYIYDKDTNEFVVMNNDTSVYVNCNKDSFKINFNGLRNKDTIINLPIYSNKVGSCLNINYFNHSLARPGRTVYGEIEYVNTGFSEALNSYLEIEIDTARIESLITPNGSLNGNIIRYNLGNLQPYKKGKIQLNFKIRTNVVIGTTVCLRANIYPRCNNVKSSFDSISFANTIECINKDSVNLIVKNKSIKSLTKPSILEVYSNEKLVSVDTLFFNPNEQKSLGLKIDSNMTLSAILKCNHKDLVIPNIIRQNDLCALKAPIKTNRVSLNFPRHDNSKEYEEDCFYIIGSYDPNIKTVKPAGMFNQHYTSNGTELKYRIDFQNTGTDTAFRVVLVDTLSPYLNIASFLPGASSHTYSVEFSGRAVKFIFDPISLVDSGTNEPASRGYVNFKINHISGILPKTKIENKADIYFDFNAPIRTNAVLNTIFDTIQIYIPKIVVLDTLFVAPDSLTIPALANNLGKINIQSNKSWTASSNQSWATLSMNSGTGSKQILIQAAANFGTKRVAIITVNLGGNVSKTVKLIQLDSQARFLNVSPDTIFAPASASNNLQFSVNSNTSWNLVSMQPWVSLNSSSGVNNKSITLNIQANSSSSKRIASISVTSGTLPSRNLVIVQASKNSSAINKESSKDADIYPIPVRDKFYLQMSEPVKDLSIEIYDMQGRMIKTVSSTNNQTIEVSAEGMTKGMYHITVKSGEKLVVVKKVMVE